MLSRSLPAPSIGPELKHWHLSLDRDGIAWLYADRAEEAVNTLSFEMMAELDQALDAVSITNAKGLAILSAKKTGFFLGADIREFDSWTTEGEVAEALERGHKLFDRLDAFPITTVCGIDGACAGGGLEVALACDYRIAVNQPKTRLGLPEVKLGIFPGLGGTARLTHLIGGKDALPLMLTGKLLRAGPARGLGIVDKLVGPHESLEWAIRAAILKGQKSKGASTLGRLSNSTPARKALAKIMTRETAKKARPEHYPAPFALIDSWRDHGSSKRAMLAAEKEKFPALMVSDTARNLRRVFALSERLKSFGKVAADRNLPTIRRVHVIGAGVMGADIAAWAALKGFEVTLQDLDQTAIDAGLGRAKKLFAKRLRGAERKTAMTRLRSDHAGLGAQSADLIIEAIVERLDNKQALYAQLEPKMKAGAILATNTSSLDLNDLSATLANPSNLVGIHFFNPVALMPLVEVIHSEVTDKDVMDRVSAFVAGIDKLPLPTKSAPGFLVNRVLVEYMHTAFLEYQNGVALEDLDEAALAFGMPMGPAETADMVGLDVGTSVVKVMGKDVPSALTDLIEDGHLGKKTGRGLYVWDKGKPKKGEVTLNDSELHALGLKLIMPLVEETERCVVEGIVEDADLADAGVIFGTGFAPFRGGPMRYLQSIAS